ncbi:protein kinase domain-containing protein [Citrus sinensis]|nr:protein kinase domain-containing protein [Citrus sinensis]
MCLNDSDLNIEFDCINNDVLPKENEKRNPNELTVENSEQPPLMPSHNQNSGMLEMCTKQYKGLVYSKEYQEQKRKRNIVLQHHQESDQRLDHENSNKNPTGNFELNSSNQKDLPIALRKGVRSCTKHPLSNFISYNNVTLPFEALKVPEWREAIFEEMRALEKNATWGKVDLPQGKVVVGCKWVFTVKYNSDGSLERYKARLVAKSYTQTYGIDYSETFSPVAKLNIVCVLLSIAANLDSSLNQLDVKNAFINGDLEEEAYHTLFTKVSTKDKLSVLIVYVDDIIMIGDDTEEMSRLKQCLVKEFEIKDLGQLRYFLGMEIARSKKGIVVSQRKYTLDLLKETSMSGCKPADTPIEANVKLEEVKGGVHVDAGRYQRLVGKLIYLSHTRPDIAFAVSVVSQFMHSPCEEHFEAVFRILRYLKATPRKGLFCGKNQQRGIEVYTDIDWAFTWRSKKQSVVARSSAEAEFRSMAQGECEVLWLKRVLEELKQPFSLPMRLYCDNKLAISIAHNPVLHDRTKHVEIDRHFIKEKLDKGIICTPFVPTVKQFADVFTKSLMRQPFELQVSKLGMIDIFAPT